MNYYGATQETVDVEFGETSVTLKKRGSSTVTTAKVLHRELDDKGGVKYAVLDRVVHGTWDCKIDEFQCSGVYVTEMRRDVAER